MADIDGKLSDNETVKDEFNFEPIKNRNWYLLQ